MADSHKNVCKEEEPGVMGIGTEPSFAIGQRALLIRTGPSDIPSMHATLLSCICIFYAWQKD